ncbi:hypothetical protein Cni_G06266 [Canna indica]|uniref:Uncharacterized protein n=1 Tax=Canna indica TaxID=4628 RepID=A0AAQ3JY73_9LILI|nr:hypothetical protein Cni_G06266 [Canna indica]
MVRVFASGGRAASRLATVALRPKAGAPGDPDGARDGDICAPVAVPASSPASSPPKRLFSESEVRLNALFWSKPCSLTLPFKSPLRVEEPQYDGFRRIALKLMLFYNANVNDLANVIWRKKQFFLKMVLRFRMMLLQMLMSKPWLDTLAGIYLSFVNRQGSFILWQLHVYLIGEQV